MTVKTRSQLKADLAVPPLITDLQPKDQIDSAFNLTDNTITDILPAQTGQSGKALVSNGTAAGWASVTSPPGGSTTQVQYNDAGAFAGSASLTWNDSTHTLAVPNVAAADTITVTSGDPTHVPLTVVANESQSANLQEWQNSDGSVFSCVGPFGYQVSANPADGFLAAGGASGHGFYLGSTAANTASINGDTTAYTLTMLAGLAKLLLSDTGGLTFQNANSTNVLTALRDGGVTMNFVQSQAGPVLTLTGNAAVPTLRMTRSAANSPVVDLYQNKVTTTNASVTTLHTFATSADTVYLLSARVLARRTGGTGGASGDSAVYERIVKVKNVAGTVTLGTVAATVTSEDQAAWDCTFAVSGTNVNLTVTGANNNNITWHLVEGRVSGLST